MSLQKNVKEKAKNIEFSPSLISEDYVHAVFRCVCCRRKFGGADYRREDMEKMLQSDSPLCKNCAKFLKKYQEKTDARNKKELGKVAQQIRDRILRYEGLLRRNNLVDLRLDTELGRHPIFSDVSKPRIEELEWVLGLLVDSGTLETLEIMKDKKLMKLIRDARKKGSKSSPYKPLVENSKKPKRKCQTCHKPFDPVTHRCGWNATKCPWCGQVQQYDFEEVEGDALRTKEGEK